MTSVPWSRSDIALHNAKVLQDMPRMILRFYNGRGEVVREVDSYSYIGIIMVTLPIRKVIHLMEKLSIDSITVQDGKAEILRTVTVTRKEEIKG